MKNKISTILMFLTLSLSSNAQVIDLRNKTAIPTFRGLNVLGEVSQNPTLPSGTENITPAFSGAGNFSPALCINSPVGIYSGSSCFGYGTSGPETGTLTFRNNFLGTNTLAIENINPNGFATTTYRGADLYYTNTLTSFEHLAVGWGGQQLQFNFIESSFFDGNNNPAYPPAPFIIQQTGGVDPTGGVSSTCTLNTTTTITCTPAITVTNTPTTNIIPLVGGRNYVGDAPANTGIPTNTTVVSSNTVSNVTTIVMSKSATLNGTKTLSFVKPSYNKFATMEWTRNGAIKIYDWYGITLANFDRVGRCISVNSDSCTHMLEVNGNMQLNGDLNFANSQRIYTNNGPLTLSGANNYVTVGVANPGLLNILQINNPSTVIGSSSVLSINNGIANANVSLNLIQQTPTQSYAYFDMGSAVTGMDFRAPAFSFGPTGGNGNIALLVTPNTASSGNFISLNVSTGSFGPSIHCCSFIRGYNSEIQIKSDYNTTYLSDALVVVSNSLRINPVSVGTLGTCNSSVNATNSQAQYSQNIRIVNDASNSSPGGVLVAGGNKTYIAICDPNAGTGGAWTAH